jgi:hypothetical protein
LKEISLRTRILRNFNPSTDDPISFVSIGEDTWFGRFQDAAEPVLPLLDGINCAEANSSGCAAFLRRYVRSNEFRAGFEKKVPVPWLKVLSQQKLQQVRKPRATSRDQPVRAAGCTICGCRLIQI